MENEAKISCFAYRNREGHEACTALRELYCKKEECRFYKPVHKVDMKQREKDIKNYSEKNKNGGTEEWQDKKEI